MKEALSLRKMSGSIEKIINECTRCGLCMKECVMLKEYDMLPGDYFSRADGTGQIDNEAPYSCTNCGLCQKLCPQGLNIGEALMDIRRAIARENGGSSPMRGHKAVVKHQTFSFSGVFSAMLPGTREGRTKRVFMPGCSLSSYSPLLVEKTYEYLKERLPGTGVILMCCGKPTLDMGDERNFIKRFRLLEKEIESLGADEVITACQNCFVTISKYSPGLRVRSLWSVMPQIGLPYGVPGIGRESTEVYSIHDACPTRDYSEIHDGIRWIVRELGYEVKESEFSRGLARCCGFGAMASAANPELGRRMMDKAASSCASGSCITYCASCSEALARGGVNSSHILDLVFGKALKEGPVVRERANAPVIKWLNRYKTKIRLKKTIHI